MTIQAQPTTTPAGGAANPSGAQPPTPQPPPPTSSFRGSATGEFVGAPPSTETAKPEAQTTPARPTTQTVRRPVLVSDLGEQGLASKLARTRAQAEKELLDKLGIKDPAAFKTQRQQEAAELERLKKAEEEQKRAQMSEVERLNSDLKAAQEALAVAQQRIEELEAMQVAQEQAVIVRQAASKYVDESAVDLAEYHFKQHVREVEKSDPKQLETMSERDVERWMQKWVTARPKFAITPSTTSQETTKTETKTSTVPATAKKPEVVRRPIGKPAVTRPTPQPAQPAPGTINGKTVRPGQANSMSKQELNDHLRKQGFRGWS